MSEVYVREFIEEARRRARDTQAKAVMEFIEEAVRRLAEKRDEEVQAALARQMQVRQAWGIVLDSVRDQLPDILRGFVTVPADEMDGAPYAGQKKFRNIQLQVPGCTPIDLMFESYSWAIDLFWPRQAMGIWEEDDRVELESGLHERCEDVYTAVATANENYPAWKKLEEEVAWRREAIRVMQERIDAQGDDEGEIGDHDEERDRIAEFGWG